MKCRLNFSFFAIGTVEHTNRYSRTYRLIMIDIASLIVVTWVPGVPLGGYSRDGGYFSTGLKGGVHRGGTDRMVYMLVGEH